MPVKRRDASSCHPGQLQSGKVKCACRWRACKALQVIKSTPCPVFLLWTCLIESDLLRSPSVLTTWSFFYTEQCTFNKSNAWDYYFKFLIIENLKYISIAICPSREKSFTICPYTSWPILLYLQLLPIPATSGLFWISRII